MYHSITGFSVFAVRLFQSPLFHLISFFYSLIKGFCGKSKNKAIFIRRDNNLEYIAKLYDTRNCIYICSRYTSFIHLKLSKSYWNCTKIKHIKYDFKLFLNSNIPIILSCISAVFFSFKSFIYFENLFFRRTYPSPWIYFYLAFSFPFFEFD